MNQNLTQRRQPRNSRRNNRRKRRNNNATNRQRSGRKSNQPPTAYGSRNRTGRMKVSRVTFNSQTIIHREYLGGIPSPTTSQYQIVKSVSVNPGLAASFPWLSSIAKNYESYRFNYLKYEYVPMVSTNTAGKIAMMLDYDALDDKPVSPIAMQNSAGAVSTQVWNSITLSSSKEQMNKAYKSKFIRTTQPPENSDLKTYDAGLLNIATTGFSAIAPGDLYCSYSVTLLTPQIPDPSRLGNAQTFKSKTGTANHPFTDATENGVPIVTKTTPGTFDRFTFNEAGAYLANFGARAMGAGGGKIDGGNTLTTVNNIISGKLPGQGQFREMLINANPGEYIDLQGTGATSVDEYKNNYLTLERLSRDDELRWLEATTVDLSHTFVGSSYVNGNP